MTRTTVYRSLNDGDPRSETEADAFQEADEDGAYGTALEIDLGGNFQSTIRIQGGEAVDVFLRGFPSEDIDSEHFGRKWRSYKVALNGDPVTQGYLATGRPSAVDIVVGGERLSIPPGQKVELNVLGEPAGASAGDGE